MVLIFFRVIFGIVVLKYFGKTTSVKTLNIMKIKTIVFVFERCL